MLTSIQCEFGAPLNRQELHVLVIVLQKVLLLHLPYTLPQPEKPHDSKGHTEDYDIYHFIIFKCIWVYVSLYAKTFRHKI